MVQPTENNEGNQVIPDSMKENMKNYGGSPLAPGKVGGNALASKVGENAPELKMGGKKSRKYKRRGGAAVESKHAGGRRSRKSKKSRKNRRFRK
jgi:hypothetical protein